MTQATPIPCYILHRRPYRESSAIIDVVAEGFGRLGLILRGAYDKKKTGVGAMAQIFRPLLLSFGGQGTLKTVRTIEAIGVAPALKENHLYSGFYINELICRLWPQNIAGDELFELYRHTLTALLTSQAPPGNAGRGTGADKGLEAVLRRFEFDLLNALGYGIDCHYCCDSGEAIDRSQEYHFIPQQGFSRLPGQQASGPQASFDGAAIRAIAEQDFTAVAVLRAAKQLSRLALSAHLGHKPLKSRELFIRVC